MSNTSISVFQLLLSKSKKNPVTCEKCTKFIPEGHLYCIQIINNKKYIGEYSVGCTHTEFDGESWCDSCVTIVNKQIHCVNCAEINWGVPSLKKNQTYMWTDGSESSIK
jgi:hypothetical protein